MRIREFVTSFDWILTGAALLLVLLGLAMLFSSTADQILFSGRLMRQLLSLGLAIGIYVLVSMFPYHIWRRHAPALYGLGILTLIIVSQMGRVIRGTTSRFEIIGAQIQPSEFMKLLLIIALAWLFAKWNANTISGFFISTIVAGCAVVLVAIEPDLGTAALMLGLWIGLIIYSGVPWKYIAAIGIMGAATGVAAWQWFFADYQKARILTFLNPERDPLGAGYNVVQSIVALGSGGFLGRGLGHGPQSQLKFLPEQHTDFIFASVGEELGFVGISLILVLYGILLWRILKIGLSTEDPFGRLLAVGAFLLLLMSFFVSAGMNMGLLPVTGIPLPLVSYGGSNLLSTFIILAIVQSVHRFNMWTRKAPSELAHFT